MTPTMRQALARESFASKIEKVGQLIRLSAKFKAARTQAERAGVADSIVVPRSRSAGVDDVQSDEPRD